MLKENKYVKLIHLAAPQTFKVNSSFTEVGVTGYCHSAEVDNNRVDSVIPRGGQNTLIAFLWRSSCDVKSGHQLRWTRWRRDGIADPFYVHRNTLSINLGSGSTVD